MSALHYQQHYEWTRWEGEVNNWPNYAEFLYGFSIITSHLGMGSSHRDKLICMIVLHISRVAERDAGGGGVGDSKLAISV